MSSLDFTYRSLARAWSADELADRYHAALDRAASDLPVDEDPSDRPITLLATAVPRLISLAVATTVLHTLPDQAHAPNAGLADALLATIDATAAGSLHRGHLALHADGQSRGYDVPDWLTLAYDQAGHALNRASPTTDPPSLIEHAQQAGRFAAIAIVLPRQRSPIGARGDLRLPRTPALRVRVRRRDQRSPQRVAVPSAPQCRPPQRAGGGNRRRRSRGASIVNAW